MTMLKGLTKGQKAYTSVQCGRGPEDHIELNSDLVYSEYQAFLKGNIPNKTFQSTIRVNQTSRSTFPLRTEPNGICGH